MKIPTRPLGSVFEKAPFYQKINMEEGLDEDLVPEQSLSQLRSNLTMIEKQCKILTNFQTSETIENLKRTISALEGRDNVKYCFVLSNDILLTSSGFRVQTQVFKADEDLHRWQYQRDSSLRGKNIYSVFTKDIDDLCNSDPDAVKRRLGANVHLRDIVPENCIYDWKCCEQTDPDPCCAIKECFCCCYPCFCFSSLLDWYFRYRFGSRYGDPRKLFSNKKYMDSC